MMDLVPGAPRLVGPQAMWANSTEHSIFNPGMAPMLVYSHNPAGQPQWGNTIAGQTQMWVQNNESQPQMWVQNNESQPQMWINNGVEQPIMNVIISPPANCTQYTTITEIKSDAPKEPIGSSVSDYLMFLYESGNYSDIVFNLVEFGVTVPAHSLLLTARSEQFRKIFIESQSSPCVIPVEGTTVEIFKLFLQCFYSDKVEFHTSVSVEILRLAYRFDVRSLIARCATSVRDNININSVWCIFKIACECDQADLKYWCLEFVSQNASAALKENNFEKLTLDKVLIVVSHDALLVPEVEIFKAILRWADTDARRRKLPVTVAGRLKLIGPLLPYIRFPLMSTDELKSVVRQTEVLTAVDFGDIFIYVDERERGKVNVNITPRFDTTPRGSKHVALMYEEACHREPSTYLSSNGEKHVFIQEFRFQTDIDMYLCGICLYGSGLFGRVKSRSLYVDYDITFRIMGENRQQNFLTTYESKRSASQDFEELFPSHYPILKECWYTAVVEISGYRERFGTRRVLQKEMKLSGGRFAIVKYYERKDASVFSHSGICRGLIFSMNSGYN